MKKILSFITALMFLIHPAFSQKLTADEITRLREKIEPYVALTDSAPDWLTSRLQMYWN